MDEREIEQVLRAGLEAKAFDADVAVPVVTRAREQVARRRRTRWSVGAAAASVVLVVGGIAALTAGGERKESGEPPVVNRPTVTELPGGNASWRTEYWGGVAVDVPIVWGFGGAPAESGGEVVACYPESIVGPDGSRRRPGERGWVGRPIAVTDVCARYPWIEYSPQEEPAAPYVWLGAEVEPGTVEYDNGYVQETIEVAGTTVTVAHDDADLREVILDSARPGRLCDVALPGIPDPRAGVAPERRGGLILAEVCAYRLGDTGELELSYAAPIEPADAESAFAAAEQAPAARGDCIDLSFELVVLHATYNDEFPNDVLERTAVYETGCGGTVALGAGDVRVLTPEAVAPWAANGIPAVVYGPSGGKGGMIDSFIGRLG